MRRPRPIEPAPGTARLRRRRAGERVELWTETVGRLPPVYGERWRTFGPASYRAFEPGRSKLAAALTRGWSGPLPAPGERWLYLGAATGTTASHVADLVGPAGRVYAVERSLRPFARLLRLAERWPNLLPISGTRALRSGTATFSRSSTGSTATWRSRSSWRSSAATWPCSWRVEGGRSCWRSRRRAWDATCRPRRGRGPPRRSWTISSGSSRPHGSTRSIGRTS